MKRKLLTTACALLAFAGSSYAQADGEYYLYDTGTKTFLTRGAGWGTRAITNKYGMLFTWNSTDGTITFKDSDLRLYTINSDIYTDKTINSTGWQFVASNDGYLLKYGTSGKYVGHAAADSEIIDFVDNEKDAVVWQFKTKAERDAIIAKNVSEYYESIISSTGMSVTADKFVETINDASIFATKDMTSSIGTATFSGSIGSWTWNEVRAEESGQPAYGTNFAEVWNRRTGSFTQTINVPKGIYKVTVNALERNGGFAKCNTLGGAGYELTTATLEANDASVLLQSWYSARTGTNNPNSTGEAIAKFNEGKYLNELYTYVGDDGVLNLKVNIPSWVNDRWVVFNNFTLTYYTDQVSEEDAKTLLASVPTEAMNSETAATLASAKAALEANKTISNYNALTSAITAANASIAGYANLKAALDNAATQKAAYESGKPTYTATFDTNIAAIQTAYDAASVADGDIDAKVAEVNAEILKLIKSQSVIGTDITACLPGADSNTSVEGWTLETSATPHTFHLNTWSTETDGSGMFKPFLEYWRDAHEGAALTDATITYAATDLNPNAIYKVTAFIRQYDETISLGEINGASLFAGGYSVDACTGRAAKYNDKPLKYGTYSIEGKTDAAGNLNFGIAISGGTFNWIAWKNLTVTYMGAAASTEEIEQFKAALAVGDQKAAKLGFEAGEFAPFNGLAVYKEAKAVNLESAVSSATITALTEKLNAWTANTVEVNAVYDGTFKDQPAQATSENVVLPGWYTVSGNTRQMFKGADSKACLAGADDASGLFVHTGTYQYGTIEGYTMPLKAGKAYVAKAKYCSWENNSNNGFSLTILKNGTTVATKSFDANKAIVDAADALRSVELLFRAEEAGDYVLQVTASGNTFMTDFYVVSATAEELAISENEAYTPAEKYANVTLTRSFAAGWNGFVVPFDMTIDDVKSVFGATEVKKFASITTSAAGATLNFEDATEVRAGVPVMIKVAEATSSKEYKVNGVYLPGAALSPVTCSNGAGDVTYSFKGTYAPETVSGPFTLIQGAHFYNYKEGENAKANALRAYFANESIAPESAYAKVAAFYFGGGNPTSVISAAEAADGAAQEGMKDLLGREVKTAVKGGVYIKNGTKFLR